MGSFVDVCLAFEEGDWNIQNPLTRSRKKKLEEKIDLLLDFGLSLDHKPNWNISSIGTMV